MNLLRCLLICIGIVLIVASEEMTLSNMLRVKKAMEDLSCPVEAIPIQRRSQEEVSNGPSALPLVLEER